MFWLFAAIVCANGLAVACRAESVEEARVAVEQEFAAALEQLAVSCEQNNLTEEAAQTRAWPPQVDPGRLHLVDPPARVGSLDGEKEPSPLRADWRTGFAKFRREQADKLFDLATRAMKESQPWLAIELTRAAIRENPDHPDARRVLGYVRSGEFWRTRFDIAQAQKGLAWDDRFGWIRPENVERYENGERQNGRRWVSAEDDAKAHADITKGWQVETEHYRVTTNHSLEAGVELAAELEFLYRSWKQVFLPYCATEKDIAAMFNAKTPKSGKGRKHEVIYFRDQAEYKHHLRGTVPDNFVTTGIYIGENKTAYFYPYQPAEEKEKGEPAAPDHTTLYHEATHQLFSETRAGAREPAAKANFWIVEGVACYMESLAHGESGCTVGGQDNDRFLSARHWLNEGDFYLPLVELTALGQDQVQRHERLATLYSQSTGLTHFLMHHKDGLYRSALMRYLEAVYAGRDRPSTLAELTGEAYKTLDQQYREFMQP